MSAGAHARGTRAERTDNRSEQQVPEILAFRPHAGRARVISPARSTR